MASGATIFPNVTRTSARRKEFVPLASRNSRFPTGAGARFVSLLLNGIGSLGAPATRVRAGTHIAEPDESQLAILLPLGGGWSRLEPILVYPGARCKRTDWNSVRQPDVQGSGFGVHGEPGRAEPRGRRMVWKGGLCPHWGEESCWECAGIWLGHLRRVGSHFVPVPLGKLRA